MSRLEDTVKTLISNFKIAQEEYTEMQLVSLITQMIQSGDIQLYAYQDKWNDLAELSYKPYRDKQYLMDRIAKLAKVNELLTKQRDQYAGKLSPYEIITPDSYDNKLRIIADLNKEVSELVEKIEAEQAEQRKSY